MLERDNCDAKKMRPLSIRVRGIILNSYDTCMIVFV